MVRSVVSIRAGVAATVGCGAALAYRVSSSASQTLATRSTTITVAAVSQGVVSRCGDTRLCQGMTGPALACGESTVRIRLKSRPFKVGEGRMLEAAYPRRSTTDWNPRYSL